MAWLLDQIKSNTYFALIILIKSNSSTQIEKKNVCFVRLYFVQVIIAVPIVCVATLYTNQ